MKVRKSLAVIIFAAAAGACYQNESSTKATASFGVNAVETTRLIEKRILAVSGFQILNEFIRPDVRAKLDEEPTGDADAGFSPDSVHSESTNEPSSEPFAEAENEPVANAEDSAGQIAEIERAKFSWAKKRIGEMIRSDENVSGLIVLYADENFYDTGRLLSFIEEGRNRIAADTGVNAERIQVSFGGYRATPQVEFWLVPNGQPAPEFRADDRDKPDDLEK